MKKRKWLIMLIAVLVLALAGCGKDNGNREEEEVEEEEETEEKTEKKHTKKPKPTKEPEAVVTEEASPEEDTAIHVKNARELLEAIAPGADIVLDAGDYNLTEAIEDDAFIMNLEYCERDYNNGLRIIGIEGLTIRAEKKGMTEIYIEDPFNPVIWFNSVKDIKIENIVFGHRVEKGLCTGSVLKFEYSDNIELNNTELYGCGTYGLEAYYCVGIDCTQCSIHDCSYGIFNMNECGDVKFDTCVMNKNDGYDLLSGFSSSIVFSNCIFDQNSAEADFIDAYPQSMYLFRGCTFGKSETQSIKNLGLEHGEVAFDGKCKYDSSVMQKPIKEPVYVSSVEEFINAVGPGAVIFVEPGEYNISDYLDEVWEKEGESWNDRHSCASIETCFDGKEINFFYANGMSIIGDTDDCSEVKFITDPRYAAVFNFNSCEEVGIWNITAGHSQMGYCVGNVIDLSACSWVDFENVDLYGCGVIGISIMDKCGMVRVFDSVIHDCENGPFQCVNFNAELYVNNTKMIGSNGGGYYDHEAIQDPGDEEAFSAVYRFMRCTFGEKESNRMAFDDELYFDRCDFAEITEYPDYGYDEYPDYPEY